MKLVNYSFIFIFLFFTPSLSENPSGFLTWKETFKKITKFNDGQIRFFGFFSMFLGIMLILIAN